MGLGKQKARAKFEKFSIAFLFLSRGSNAAQEPSILFLYQQLLFSTPPFFLIHIFYLVLALLIPAILPIPLYFQNSVSPFLYPFHLTKRRGSSLHTQPNRDRVMCRTLCGSTEEESMEKCVKVTYRVSSLLPYFCRLHYVVLVVCLGNYF